MDLGSVFGGRARSMFDPNRCGKECLRSSNGELLGAPEFCSQLALVEPPHL